MKVTVSLEDEEVRVLKKRAKKNILTLKEQVEDIIRRSCIRSRGKSYRKFKADDRLIRIFSRDKRGRKKVRKKK